MNFTVRNYRKISTADIELSPLTLIGGNHAAGKSSLIEAIASTALASANPFKDVVKKEISMLVHSGSPSGYSEIIDGENTGRVDWPKCDYSSNGKPVTASLIATGVQSLVDMDTPKRINYIVEMMQAEPTDDDLVRELIAADVIKKDGGGKDSNFFKRIWEEIKFNGWDNANEKAREMGRKLKAKWEILTGAKNYGIRIAEQWQPPAWSPELEKVPEVDLINDVKKAKEWYEAAIKDVAISDHEISRLTVLSDNIIAIQKRYDTIVKKQEVVEGEMLKKKKRIRELDSGEEIRGLVCPECQATLTISNGVLKTIPKAEHKKAQKDKAEIELLRKDVDSLQNQNNEILKEFGEEKSALGVAKQAADKLAVIKKKQSGADDAKIEEVKNKLALAEERLKAYRDYTAAHKMARSIIINQKLCGVLAPDGIRNKKLTSAFSKINNSMKALTDGVGWRPVEINKDCRVLVGGVPYGRLIAKSERYRARVLLQLMVAMAEKSPFILVDDADELTPLVKNELMRVILKSKIKAIVVSALDKKTDLPDVSKISGRSYWIEEGKIV